MEPQQAYHVLQMALRRAVLQAGDTGTAGEGWCCTTPHLVLTTNLKALVLVNARGGNEGVVGKGDCAVCYCRYGRCNLMLTQHSTKRPERPLVSMLAAEQTADHVVSREDC